MLNMIAVDYYNLENKLNTEQLSVEFLSKNMAKITDIPLFAPNLAKDDIVLVECENGFYYFDGFVEYSNNSTIQIILLGNDDTIIKSLLKFDIDIRYFNHHYFSIHIPKQTHYFPIFQMLRDLEDDGKLSFKESCLAYCHKKEKSI